MACDGCSGSCTGCNDCSDKCWGCSGCGGACSDNCGDSCSGCSSCKGTCQGGCSSGCEGGCRGCSTCTGCTGCGGSCSNDCTACTGSCKNQCDNGCSATSTLENITNAKNNMSTGKIIYAADINVIINQILKELSRRSLSGSSTAVTKGNQTKTAVKNNIVSDLKKMKSFSTTFNSTTMTANEMQTLINYLIELVNQNLQR